MAIAIRVLVALLVFFSGLAQAAPEKGFVSTKTNPFLWKKVGVDPCNPKTGCTLLWALQQWGVPKEVLTGLIAKVQTTTAGTTSLKAGDKDFWMTWGQQTPKFQMYVVADWPAGQVEKAAYWSVDHEGRRYHLVQVNECKNWGGWITTAPAAAPPAKPPVINLGTVPRIACPEQQKPNQGDAK